MSVIPTVLSAPGAAVETRGLAKRFGSRVALDRLDMTVPEGSVYVLVGPNGAGKTTTLRILLDLVRAEAGDARVYGLDSVKDGPAVRARCGYLPERQDAGYGWMKVQQLVAHHAAYRSGWDDASARFALARASASQSSAIPARARRRSPAS